MPTRNLHWVGGTASWNGTAGSKWSLSAGGAGGEAIPTAIDNVFFDSSSGSGTVTVAANGMTCANLDFNGFTGTFTDDGNARNVTVAGTVLRLGSGMTLTSPGGGSSFTLSSTSGAVAVTSNGKTWTWTLSAVSGAGGISLQDNIVSVVNVGCGGGGTDVFQDNGHSLTCRHFATSNSGVVLTRSGAWTITGDDVVGGGETYKMVALSGSSDTGSVTINGSSSDTKTVAGAKTLTLGGSGTGTFILGSFTATTLTVSSPPHAISINHGETVTAGTLNISGTAGNKNSITDGSISVASGILSFDYLSLTNNIATGGARFFAGNHSDDGGGNTNWIFGSPRQAQAMVIT